MKFVSVVLLLLFSWSAFAEDMPDPEEDIFLALEEIQSTHLDQAAHRLKSLLQREPDFKLAQLLYGDILKARTRGLHNPGQAIKDTSQLDPLLQEARLRFAAKLNNKPYDRIPAPLLWVDSSIKNVILVDLSQSRLYVMSNQSGIPKLTSDYFVSMGRGGPSKEKSGDLKTPLGVYFVQNYIPQEQLADKYGAGAYPLNYPNAWDRMQGRTGSGIWLHGTRSGTYNRPPLASEGCVVLPNRNLLKVGARITQGETPVIIGENIQWLSQQQWREQSQQYHQRVQGWVNDWQDLDVNAYLQHYSKQFNNGHFTYASWSQHKQRVSRVKQFIHVKLSHLSIYHHPDADLFVATFQQDYQSNNYTSLSWKRQYWKKDADGVWRIIYEGRIEPPKDRLQLVRR